MLDIKSNKKEIHKYLIISISILIFGIIYELFSHGVYSSYMMFAFLIPLILGYLFYGIIYYTNTNKYISKSGSQVFNSGIFSLTIGSIMTGVLDIYGTTNNLISVYLKLGIILIIISFIINLIYNIKRKDVDKI